MSTKPKPIIKKKSSLHLPLNVLDLFCGCGGMTTGLVAAGFNVVAGIDIWDTAIETYRMNHAHSAICADLTQYTPEEFHKHHNQQIDVLVGGPPCQSFSMAGKRDRNDPRGSLFMEYVKYLDYFNPKAFIMENVMGILSAKTAAGELVIDIITSLLSRNYRIVVCKLYASDFEVPQNRRRVIIIGIRKDLNVTPTEPLPVGTRPPVKTVLEDRSLVPSSYYLSDMALAGIRAKKERMESKGHGFGAQFLDQEKPSYTIPARYWKDGYDALVRYDDIHVRRLTEIELKRIQSFPDNYKFYGNRKDTIIQIGNAVACRFAYHLGRHVAKLLYSAINSVSQYPAGALQ